MEHTVGSSILGLLPGDGGSCMDSLGTHDCGFASSSTILDILASQIWTDPKGKNTSGGEQTSPDTGSGGSGIGYVCTIAGIRLKRMDSLPHGCVLLTNSRSSLLLNGCTSFLLRELGNGKSTPKPIGMKCTQIDGTSTDGTKPAETTSKRG